MTLTLATFSSAAGDGVLLPDRSSPDLTSTDLGTAELCRDTPGATELFFSENLTDITTAKRICAVCPSIASCLEGAMERSEPCGVWGGQLFERGRIVQRKRRRGRPPKHPRPEDQVPDLPIPEHLQARASAHHGGRELLTA